jgi:transposase-like protein
MSENILLCPKCSNKHIWKNGFIHDHKQRYYCKQCNYNFTENTRLDYQHKHTKPESLKKLALKLYLKGNSYRDIQDILDNQVGRTTVMKWVKKKDLKSNKNKS